MNLREGWNQHNDIGIKLENIARGIVNPGKPYGADGTIFSADSIEEGTFAEVMICLLRLKKGFAENSDIKEFSDSLGEIWSKSLNLIEPVKAQELMEKFEKLMD